MKHILQLLLMFAIAGNCTAQQTKDNIEGTWKGTSLCQVKPSPCHDENVVYHISKAASGKMYSMQANKIINGVEEGMGTLDGSYDETQHILTVTMKDKQDRTNVWLFKIDGKQMHGTLTVDEKTLFRVIEVKKAD
ncbi:MAG TPA: hypothetical protein VGQ53_00835 [Chitinophagaceae bacterium]|nr:hypothetical protein [Chitinophagaceae bacterium]